MPLYIVRFITASGEATECEYEAANAAECMDVAEAEFRPHHMLHEIVVCPPAGQTYFDSIDCPDRPDEIVEFYRLTPAGRRTVEENAAAVLRKRLH